MPGGDLCDDCGNRCCYGCRLLDYEKNVCKAHSDRGKCCYSIEEMEKAGMLKQFFKLYPYCVYRARYKELWSIEPTPDDEQWHNLAPLFAAVELQAKEVAKKKTKVLRLLACRDIIKTLVKIEEMIRNTCVDCQKRR